jgi:hypothetical protein
MRRTGDAMTVSRVIIVVGLGLGLVLGACGGSSMPAAPPNAPVATCTTAAENTVGTMVAVLDPRPPAADIQKYIDLIRERCEQDGWSAQAQRCMSEIKQRQDGERCEPLLTDAQKAALVRDQEAKFGGGPPPPTP